MSHGVLTAAPIAPTTRLGRWAVGLALAFPVLVTGWAILPGGAALGLVCGLAGGILALRAIASHGERGVAVFAALLPLVLVVGFVLAELLVGHD
jgi:hypothetical protein